MYLFSRARAVIFVVHKINNSTLILSCILKQLFIHSKHKNYSWFTLILKLWFTLILRYTIACLLYPVQKCILVGMSDSVDTDRGWECEATGRTVEGLAGRGFPYHYSNYYITAVGHKGVSVLVFMLSKPDLTGSYFYCQFPCPFHPPLHNHVFLCFHLAFGSVIQTNEYMLKKVNF